MCMYMCIYIYGYMHIYIYIYMFWLGGRKSILYCRINLRFEGTDVQQVRTADRAPQACMRAMPKNRISR